MKFRETSEGNNLLINSLPFYAALIDESGVVTQVNENWQKFMSLNQFEFARAGLGERYLRIIEAVIKDENQKRIRKAKTLPGKISDKLKQVLLERSEKETLVFSFTLDGSKRWFKVIMTPHREGALVLHEDITQQRLRKIKADALFDNSTSAIVVLDEKGRITDINKKFKQVFGYELSELAGKFVLDALAQGKINASDERMTEELYLGKQSEKEGIRYNREGSPRQFVIKGIPIIVDEALAGFYGIYDDITALKRSKEKLNAIFKSSLGLYYLITEPIEGGDDALIKDFSPGAQKVFGYNENDILKEDILNHRISSFIPPKSMSRIRKIHHQVAQGVEITSKSDIVLRDGKEFPFISNIFPFKSGDRENQIISVSMNISELEQAKEELQETKNLLSSILMSIQDGISVLNPDLTIRYANKTLNDWYEDETPLENNLCYQSFNNFTEPCPNCPSLRALASGKVESEVVPGKTGSALEWLEVFCYPMINEATGETEGVVEFVRDISERRRRENKIIYLSRHDELTGLHNRFYLEQVLAESDGDVIPTSIIMVDINGLNIINTSYGQDMGDTILCQMADVLADIIDVNDYVARWAGDEFILFLPGTERKDAEELRHLIRQRLEDEPVAGIPVSLGMGIAVKTSREQDIFSVLQQAEKRMQDNKLTDAASSKNKLVRNLVSTLETKSHETADHANRMIRFALKLGRELGLTEEQLNHLSLVAVLHDIGKVMIPEDILTKSTKLDEKEWEIIKEHPERGYRIAAATEEFAPVAHYILHHHERWDGKGYPKQLKGKDIPLLVRIISIVDAYDVMTNGRPYKQPLNRSEALEELKRCSGSQFDPQLVEVFIRLFSEEEKTE
ncbi:MAG: HD domain-containing phosphohydrolase [Bacillota bacterium]